jgi:hypothetical protein
VTVETQGQRTKRTMRWPEVVQLWFLASPLVFEHFLPRFSHLRA